MKAINFACSIILLSGVVGCKVTECDLTMEGAMVKKKQPEQKIKFYQWSDNSCFEAPKYPDNTDWDGEVYKEIPCPNPKCKRKKWHSCYYKEYYIYNGREWPEILSVSGNGAVIAPRVLKALQEINATGFEVYDVKVICEAPKLRSVPKPDYIGLKFTDGGLWPNPHQTIAASYRDLSDKKTISKLKVYCHYCRNHMTDLEDKYDIMIFKFVPDVNTWNGDDFTSYKGRCFITKRVAEMLIRKKFTNSYLEHIDFVSFGVDPDPITKIDQL